MFTNTRNGLVSSHVTNGATENLNGDYSGVAIVAKFTATVPIVVTSILINIVDTKGFEPNQYGSMTALTNGVSIKLFNSSDSVIQVITIDEAKDNSDWMSFGDGTTLLGSNVNQCLSTHLHIGEIYGRCLHMNIGDYIGVTLNDNFTGLINHEFYIAGYKVQQPD
jgi:hypothetical protein